MSQDILALIPARAGSRRVQNKNIRTLGGKPLIAYTIEAALRSKQISRTIVSTDCEKIAEIAKQYGAEVPFLRPAELAGADSTEYEFHQHAVDWLKENENYEPELIVNLYPTSPFRRSTTIDRAVDAILKQPTADSLRSTKACAEHPHKMWVRNGLLVEPYVKKATQQEHTLSYHLLPPVEIQNASIYIVRRTTLEKYQSTVGETVVGFSMSEEESIDINTPVSFDFAEWWLTRREAGRPRATSNLEEISV